ncbi:uncharacterized protein NPIL_126121 [Nephila pilipes]|uniref:Uncharacterized protein n=1 Tax=Nephila pilipes TaxID=299642 RepID=A0A8X6T3Z3_NEPPI|nr:uncharacterized protein NPIL_126121 [Nephila pilipes]
MTSFGATKIVHNENCRNFESTFKIQGQVYHQIGSLLPMPDADPKFLQIYLMGDEEQQAAYTTIFSRWKNEKLWKFGNGFAKTITNCYNCSRLFLIDYRTTSMSLSLKPYGEHAGTYNVPTINEVAFVMTGDPTERRDIRIQRRDNTVQIIQYNHRSYDALQYPYIFWEGEDGYHLAIKQRNPITDVVNGTRNSIVDAANQVNKAAGGTAVHLDNIQSGKWESTTIAQSHFYLNSEKKLQLENPCINGMNNLKLQSVDAKIKVLDSRLYRRSRQRRLHRHSTKPEKVNAEEGPVQAIAGGIADVVGDVASGAEGIATEIFNGIKNIANLF